MLYRAELRRLLFRQAEMLVNTEPAQKFATVLDEAMTLVPLSDREYVQAAELLTQWKNPELQRELSDDERERIIVEADSKIVRLLRYHAEIWQSDPQEIRIMLRSYTTEATGRSYAETQEFKDLLDEMKRWLD